MNNSLIPQEKGFIVKIKRFFSNLKMMFNKNTESKNIQELNKTDITYNTQNDEVSFFNQLKDETNDSDKAIEKEAFLDMLNKDSKLLNNLSIERLEKLYNFYNNIIEENNEKIRLLKQKKGIA